jgi:hypothetical protein
MRALARHPLIRLAALLLLAWISVDLCWLDMQATDADDAFATESALTHSDTCGPTHSGPLHPHDCCCHAQYVTLSTNARLSVAPTFTYLGASPLLSMPTTDLSPLYHPPQPLT